MANILVEMLFIVIFVFCLPFIETRIQCNYQTFGANGCPQDSHLMCDNTTNTCVCNQTTGFGIRFGDDQCLSVKHIDQKCLTSDQCLKTAKHQLFCFYMDLSSEKLVQLNTSLAIDLRQRLNKTIEGFCRCDDNYFYDYEENQCIHQNKSIFDMNLNPFFGEYFCSQCPIIDENSYCDRKTQNCVCNENYIKNSYGKCVRSRRLAEKCSETDECIVSNTYCEPIVEECVCGHGFYADSRNQMCLKGRPLFERCVHHRECTYLYGYCDPNRSQCLCDNNTSVLLNIISPVCVQRTNYGQSCHHRFPDVVCQLSGRHSLCSKYSNRCVCENGYIFVSSECQKMTINRLGFGDEFHEMDVNKNPMTYIVIVFCTVFGFTVFASILIKMFRRPFTRTQLALYDINSTLNHMNSNNMPETRLASAPPAYTERPIHESSQTNSSHNTNSENEDKPPSYEEAISGQYAVH